MTKFVKFLVIGGVAGAAVVAARSMKAEEPVDDLPKQAARSAGIGALTGGALGLVLDRRSRRRARRKTMKLAETARAAVPTLGRKGRKARKAAAKAARKARRRAGTVVEMAESRLHKLAS